VWIGGVVIDSGHMVKIRCGFHLLLHFFSQRVFLFDSSPDTYYAQFFLLMVGQLPQGCLLFFILLFNKWGLENRLCKFVLIRRTIQSTLN
jgi:hypothetical protein